MDPEQKATAYKIERDLATCYLRETNKPYRTLVDVQKLIKDADGPCGKYSVALKGAIGTGRLEAFWQDFEPMLVAVHPGAEDMTPYYDSP